MKPYSDARRQRDKHLPERRQEAYDRADGRCEVMALGCEGQAHQVHHRRGRVPIDGDDPHDLDLLVAACRACHDYVELNREWARERGFLLSRMGKVRPSALLREDES